MAAPIALAAAKTLGPKKLIQFFATLVGLALAFLTVGIAAPVMAVVLLASPASAGGSGDLAIVGEWGKPMMEYTVRSDFGPRDTSNCSFCSSNHQGQDIGHGCGSPIYAAGTGIVSVAGEYGGYGQAVLIDHGHGITTLYGHMQTGSATVHVGDRIGVGSRVGSEGRTGNSTGCHLHFEVRADGNAVDPVPFMKMRGVAL